MHILLMADTLPNPDSGAAGTELQTVQALRRIGHEVDTVWANELPHRIVHGNLHYLLELPFAYRNRMRERMKLHVYDVVHVNQPHGYLAARSLQGKAGKPIFVHRSHGFEPRVGAALAPWIEKFALLASNDRKLTQRVMARLLKFSHRAIARYADGHIVSSSLCAQYLEHNCAVPESSICVIPQAPPASFQVAPIHPLTANRLSKLLYVGQFAFFKAPMVLAEAFDQIVAAHPEVRLTWVCDKRHHRQAASLLTGRALARVDFVDWLGQEELLDVYDRHGVFLFPSFFEGFGKAWLEAMARGLVVIASREGGAIDCIDSWGDGVLVPVGDAKQITNSYSRLRAAPAMAVQMGVQAAAKAREFSWDRVARETTDFYQRLIDFKRDGLRER